MVEMGKVDNNSPFIQLKSINALMQKSIVFSAAFFYEWERPIWPAFCYEGVPLRFLASLFDIQMRYLVYMRYLWLEHVNLYAIGK